MTLDLQDDIVFVDPTETPCFLGFNYIDSSNSTFNESGSFYDGDLQSFDPVADNCSNPLSHVDFTDAGVIASLTILIIVNGLVVSGNCLVIVAVFSSHKLRSVTNLFIVSLAVADLLLGIAVLPFSLTVEVFETWLFGELWCSVWLAVDVWMSTASILNLCVISFDRYVAVTRPVSYPSLMTSSKAKALIGAVWVVSFVICFPPLVGWNDRKKMASASDFGCNLSCELTNEIGYVLYSALGSFFLPMLVMLFFYWKIYCAAAETTRAINRGFRTTKDSMPNRMSEERVTLRIHRGKTDNAANKKPKESRSQKFLCDALSSSDGAGPDSFELEHLNGKKMRPSRDSCLSMDTTFSLTAAVACNLGTTLAAPHTSRIRGASRMGRRNIKVQVKRFRMETKAAKTLGIIVGAFIVCWFPFFTMYLVRGFCPSCIAPLLFSVFFWLGYCNSAVNPFIYALFSKDFRFAFKNILCKCVCKKTSSGHRFPAHKPNRYMPSFGEESDENFEEGK